MFEKWELLYSPSDKDKNRWRLKMKISEDLLEDVFSRFGVSAGRPFSTTDADYNWGVYLYNLGSDERKGVIKGLREFCKEGRIVVEGMELNVEDELKGESAATERPPAAAGAEEVPAPKIQEQVPETPWQAFRSLANPPEADGRQEKTPFAAPGTEAETEQEDFWKVELNPRYTFEEFIVGPNNRFTHAAALAVAENPGKVYNPFFIYGGAGLGKTHLMQSIGHHVLKKTPASKVFYVTSEKFISEVIDSIGKGALKQFRDRYRQMDVLLVDDVQFLAESESTQEEFFHTFNILQQNNKQIVLTSDKPPKQLATLEDRLRSRFEWGLIADIKLPTLETRVAILKRKSETEHLLLDSNMLLYIAGKLKSNIRELEGFVKRVNAYANILGRQVDMDLVKELMVELLPEEEEAVKEARPREPQRPAPTREAKEGAPAAQKPRVYQQAKAAPQAAAQEAPAERPKPAPTAPPPVQPRPVTPPSMTHVPKAELSEAELEHRPIEVAFFYPEGKQEELFKAKEKFRAVIKKHNLKFRIESMFERDYDPHMKINYNMFPELCKTNKVGISIILGPPPETNIGPEEFLGALLPVMENEKISLQFIPWHELEKDYRYLNLALDITLSSHKY
jgi:chromosomal replication initiator protein DnaA